MKLTAVCTKCYHIFPSPIDLRGTGTKVIGVRSRCPQCGGTAYVLDATSDEQGKVSYTIDLSLSGQFLSILTNPQVSKADLTKLRGIAEDAKARNAVPAEVISAIELQIPNLSPLAQLLVPKDAGAFYQLLGLIVALVAIVSGSGDKTTVYQTVINLPPPPVVVKQKSQPNPGSAKQNEPGRGAPCTCGSGRTYGQCCRRRTSKKSKPPKL